MFLLGEIDSFLTQIVLIFLYLQHGRRENLALFVVYAAGFTVLYRFIVTERQN